MDLFSSVGTYFSCEFGHYTRLPGSLYLIGSRIEWEEVRKRSMEERSMQRMSRLNEADSFNENSGTAWRGTGS